MLTADELANNRRALEVEPAPDSAVQILSL